MCVGRYGISGKFVGINYALLPNREWNQKQKHKKQPWSNVECFAFGGATLRFASLETSFHAANHKIPPSPSNEGLPHCPKAVFYVFVFDSTHDSSNNAESIPRNVPLNHRNAPTCWGGEIKKRKSGVISFFCSRDEGIRTLDLCNVTAAL